MKKISILIPCYNEEENVGPMSEAIVELFTTQLQTYDYELVFIDNDSQDKTRAILREICSKNQKIKGDAHMSVIKITAENFEKEVLKNPKPVLIDFYADWCGPCQMVSPIVEDIADEYPQFAVGKVNVDEEPLLAEKFGISSIPALFVVKEGKIVAQNIGAVPKEVILRMFN